MAYTYTYNITDFPEQKVYIPRLVVEISDSLIVTVLNHINTYPTIAEIIFENQLTSPEETILNSIVATHDADGALPPEPYSFNFSVEEKGGENDITYGTPITTALPSIAKAYGATQIQVLGIKGPNLSNVIDFGVSWDLNTQSLATLNLSTSDGIPSWYVNLLPLATHTFGTPYPSLSLSGTNITNLDGDYWANVISPGTFVLYSKTEKFTLLFKDASVAYIPPQYNANFVILDENNNLFQSNIPAHVNGTEFHYITDSGLSTTTSVTYVTKLTLTVNNLPTGLYRIGIGYTWNGSSATYQFLSQVLLNSVVLGDEHVNRVANVENYIPQQRTFYKILAGNNTIELQYRTNNVAGIARIRQTSIELWRVQ
jgi:hypothetical protein